MKKSAKFIFACSERLHQPEYLSRTYGSIRLRQRATLAALATGFYVRLANGDAQSSILANAENASMRTMPSKQCRCRIVGSNERLRCANGWVGIGRHCGALSPKAEADAVAHLPATTAQKPNIRACHLGLRPCQTFRNGKITFGLNTWAGFVSQENQTPPLQHGNAHQRRGEAFLRETAEVDGTTF